MFRFVGSAGYRMLDVPLLNTRDGAVPRLGLVQGQAHLPVDV